MRRFFALLSVVLLSVFLINCGGNNAVALPPDVPHQAHTDLDQSVALVHDFGAIDHVHGAFCSGTWVSPRVIITAAHCVEGYAQMRHRMAVVVALRQAGVPDFFIWILSNIDPDDLNEELQQELAPILAIMRSVPVEPALGLDVPYLVPSQVADVGVPPYGYQHTVVTFIDDHLDVALLQTQGKVPAHGVAALADQSPAVGDSVTLVGNIRGNFFSFRQETVSAYRRTEKYNGMKDIDGPFIQLSGALVSFGDSGSGIFNSRGELVGMESFVDESQLSFGIHLETIRQVLIGQKLVKAHLDVQAPDPTLSDSSLNLE